MGWQYLSSVPILGGLLVLYWIAILIIMINDGREPTKTLAWLFLLVVFPGFGLIFYYFFGRNWKKKTMKGAWIKEIRGLVNPVFKRIQDTYAADSDEARAWSDEHGYAHLTKLIETSENSVPLPAYDVDLMPSGEEKFTKLIEDISKATDSINIQYFIWERDELTARLTTALLERLKAGVEVRMLNDYIGNIQYKKDEITRMREAGAKINYDVKEIGKVNYRDHRKIVVIDGVLGYTGGINVGQEYIDGGEKYPTWRDSHVRFWGPAVAPLQGLFSARWHEQTGENLFVERFFPLEYPVGEKRSLAQVVSTGVENPWESARRAHVVAMGLAKKRLWVQSPYYVPDDAVQETLVNAALSGIDVRFMMTGWPDKKIAWYAAESYFRPLLEAGARVYHYNAGFFHAKTMTVDGMLACIGTMNLDIRSLELHKELMVWFYDQALAEEHERIFEADLEHCDEFTLEKLDSRTPMQVFRNSAARLASNML